MSAIKKAEDFIYGVAVLWLVSRIISPRNNTAEILRDMNAAVNGMVNVAIAIGAVERRDPARFAEVLGEMNDPMMTELFARLSEPDLDWCEEMLRDA